MGENYLIAGLGNPGNEYKNTRHNVGFMVTDLLAGHWKASFYEEAKFQACLASVRLGEDRIFLSQPLTWMNSSGDAVGALVRYYQITLSKILVILDDADLPVGKIRLRPGGSTGGHHGLESVINQIGSEDFPRLRVGIGNAGLKRITGYVLGKFQKEELPIIKEVLDRATSQAICWVEHGIQKAMNEFNGDVIVPEQREN